MKKLKMRDVLSRSAWKYMTATERRAALKVEQAKECSGLSRYGSTCSAVLARIPYEWWGKYGAEHIGEVMSLLFRAYEDGRKNPSPDEWEKIRY